MPYIGHMLTADGVKPDPSKVAAIVHMPRPEYCYLSNNIDTVAVYQLLSHWTNFI